MFSFLDPQVWGALLLAIALSGAGGYFKGRSDGRTLERATAAAAVTQANIEVRKIGELRQDRVDEAAKLAATRERNLLAVAARARSERDGLRDDLDALQRASKESLATANEAIRVTSGLLATCADDYLGMAEAASRADAEARELRAAWPK